MNRKSRVGNSKDSANQQSKQDNPTKRKRIKASEGDEDDEPSNKMEKIFNWKIPRKETKTANASESNHDSNSEEKDKPLKALPAAYTEDLSLELGGEDSENRNLKKEKSSNSKRPPPPTPSAYDEKPASKSKNKASNLNPYQVFLIIFILKLSII
jgi:hypothetical protein